MGVHPVKTYQSMKLSDRINDGNNIMLIHVYDYTKLIQLPFVLRISVQADSANIHSRLNSTREGKQQDNYSPVEKKIRFHIQSLLIIKNKIDRNIPSTSSAMNVLFVWFANSNTSTTAKLLTVLTPRCQVTSGVKQGGVMSTVLFTIYTNEILVKLNSNKLIRFGCFV